MIIGNNNFNWYQDFICLLINWYQDFVFTYCVSFTPLLMIDKKGEKNLSLYAYFVCMHVLVFVCV